MGMRFYYTVKEAADILPLTQDAIRKRIHRNTLHADKWGKQWAIPMREVARIAKEYEGRVHDKQS